MSRPPTTPAPRIAFANKPDKRDALARSSPQHSLSTVRLDHRLAGVIELRDFTVDIAEYYAQGGDLGAAVTAAMGAQHPEGLLGIHVNMALAPLPALQALGESTPEEQAMLAKVKRYWDHESGYSTQQRTRPQTLGYGLADSPTGQPAWIVEKFHAWTDCNGHPENAVSRDEMLDNVTLYWLTNTATSSARLYWESFPNPVTDRAAISRRSSSPTSLRERSETVSTRCSNHRTYTAHHAANALWVHPARRIAV